MKQNIQAVLFDKDGTIFDSEACNKRAWMQSTREFGVDFSESAYEEFVGVPTQECFELAKKSLPDDFPWEAFLQTLSKNVMQNFTNGLPFKPGFEAFFAYLIDKKAHQDSLKLGLVTSAQRSGTELSFKKSGYLKDFDTIVTLDDVNEAKPNPQPYLLACEQLGLSPENTLVFEDSNIGLQSAITAGCKTVAIADLLPIEPQIKKQCYAVLNSFDEAFELV